MRTRLRGVRDRGVGRIDQRAEPHDVVEDAFDAAMVRDPDLDAGAHEIARDVGLDVGKADREIGLEREDRVDLRADERGDLRLLLARARRTHGESRDADDAALLAERVEHFGRFFGEADDALGAAHGVYWNRR